MSTQTWNSEGYSKNARYSGTATLIDRKEFSRRMRRRLSKA